MPNLRQMLPLHSPPWQTFVPSLHSVSLSFLFTGFGHLEKVIMESNENITHRWQSINFSVADPGCLTQKIVSKLSEISGMFIPDPDLDFLTIPDPGTQKSKRHRIRNTDKSPRPFGSPQLFSYRLQEFVLLSYLILVPEILWYVPGFLSFFYEHILIADSAFWPAVFCFIQIFITCVFFYREVTWRLLRKRTRDGTHLLWSGLSRRPVYHTVAPFTYVLQKIYTLLFYIYCMCPKRSRGVFYQYGTYLDTMLLISFKVPVIGRIYGASC